MSDSDLIGVEDVEGHLREIDRKRFDRLGTAYTPVELVDFVHASVQAVLRKEFGASLGDPEVCVLDPFTGPGVFIERLVENEELMSDEDLGRKLESGEIEAYEIVPEVAELATHNVREAYRKRTGETTGWAAEQRDTFGHTEEELKRRRQNTPGQTELF